MKYVIDRYKIICKNNEGETELDNAVNYTETVDFVYITSIVKDTASIERGWRGDVMVDYIVLDAKDDSPTTLTEYHWDDVILIRIEPTADRDWRYVFAKK